jgi:putative acetyltransferase
VRLSIGLGVLPAGVKKAIVGAVIVRDEQPPDIPAIHAVVEAAFGRPEEAVLVDRLRLDGDSVVSLVAVSGAELLGHVMFSRIKAPFRALGLAPVSVAPRRQGRGVGGALIRAGLERARETGWRGVFVLGDPAYYQRFGFDVGAAAGFDSLYAGPYLMVCALAGDLPARVGKVEYAPAFAGLG